MDVKTIGYPITKEEIDNDIGLIVFANKNRELLSSSPRLSFFRVYALIIIKTITNEYLIIHGTNSEADYIGSSICAERSALVKLRYFDNPKIIKVIVVTDLTMPVSPGMLCREYLMSVCDSESVIVMGGSNASDENDIKKCKMKDLWPFPYLYRSCDRSNIIEYAQSFVLKSDINLESLRFANDSNRVNNNKLEKLLRIACSYTKYDAADTLHPIKLASAVLYDDDSIDVTWMLKGLEYGCTLDPVSQMVSKMMQNRICGECKLNVSSDLNNNIFKFIKSPIMLVNVDQYGVAHSPHAQARALLTEHGFGQLEVMIHNENGQIEIVLVSSLVPNPEGVNILSNESFH